MGLGVQVAGYYHIFAGYNGPRCPGGYPLSSVITSEFVTTKVEGCYDKYYLRNVLLYRFSADEIYRQDLKILAALIAYTCLVGFEDEFFPASSGGHIVHSSAKKQPTRPGISSPDLGQLRRVSHCTFVSLSQRPLGIPLISYSAA